MTPAPVTSTPTDWRLWLLGIMTSIALALVAVVYSSLSVRLEANAQQVQHANERLAAAEATQMAIQRQLDSDIKELREGVKGLSAKLDRLIEDKHR